MIKHLLKKLLGSFFHSKHRGYRHNSSHRVQYGRRHSSSDRHYGNGHSQQGHGYYRNRQHSSS